MNMENFKRYLVNVQKSFTGVFVTIYILCALCIGFGVIKCLPAYSDYDGNKEGFAKTKILCVDEPFAKWVGDKYKNTQFQLAVGEDSNMYVVGLNPKNDFPVLSSDFTSEELASYKPVEIKGKSETLPAEAKTYLLETYGVTSENVDTILGSCYLDATYDTLSAGYPFFGVGIFVGIITLMFQSAVNQRKKAIRKKADMLEANGQLQAIYDDFQTGPQTLSKSMRLLILPHYAMDFLAEKEGFHVVPLDNVINVYQTSMVNGHPINGSGIALDTADGQQHVIGISKKQSKDFDDIMNLLKNITGGTQ